MMDTEEIGSHARIAVTSDYLAERIRAVGFLVDELITVQKEVSSLKQACANQANGKKDERQRADAAEAQLRQAQLKIGQLESDLKKAQEAAIPAECCGGYADVDCVCNGIRTGQYCSRCQKAGCKSIHNKTRGMG